MTFEKSNVEDLKQKLEQIIQQKQLIDKQQIQDYILKKYNWDDIVKKIEELYIRG